jgi:NitT/TauT family transport system substrate-binding protein
MGVDVMRAKGMWEKAMRVNAPWMNAPWMNAPWMNALWMNVQRRNVIRTGKTCGGRFPHLLRRLLFLLLPPLLLVPVAGCGSGSGSTLRISVAEQYGLAYAPVQLMREKGLLEAALAARAAPGQSVEVSWVKLANTSAIREAMLADEIDVAFTGIPPFLLGVDQGMPWRIISGLSSCPVDLYVNDASIRSLKDLIGKGRIALPQPGSIQHMLLAMAAERELGQADAFDRQLVSMKHPDGMQALLAGSDVTAHFTAPPYSFAEEAAEGIHRLLRGEEAFGGPYSFLVGISEPGFYKDDIRLEALRDALSGAMAFLGDQPGEAAALLAEEYGLTEDETRLYLERPDMVYTQDVLGVDAFVAFMHRTGYLQQAWSHSDLFAGEE